MNLSPAKPLEFLRTLIPPGPEGLVWWLTVLASVGVTSVIPLLPIYATQLGADLFVVGLMSAAFMVTNLAFLYGAGKLSDRLGRRPLMGVGLFGYMVCMLGFLWFRDPWAFVGLRALEGIAAACFLPAALAYVADRYPREQRGTRIAQLVMAENLGLLLGPVFGALINANLGMGALFGSLAALCAVGTVLIARLPASRVGPKANSFSLPEDWGDVRKSLLTGVGARAMAGGFAFGLYLTVWPIYLIQMGASAWQSSMSWTMFAVPAVILAPWSGRLIDRYGPARSAVLGAIFSAFIVVSYALTTRVDVLLMLCVVEGIGFAFAYPAQSALTLQTSPEDMRGRVIGLVNTLKTLGALLGALATPLLYHINPLICFGTTAWVLFIGAVILAICVRLDEHRPYAAHMMATQVPSAAPPPTVIRDHTNAS